MTSIVRSENETIYTIQAFRAIAAVLVVLFHATNLYNENYQIHPLNGFFLFGFSGVDLFFVLSGFIIFMIHQPDIGRPQKYFPYLTKRCIRIYPTYWLTLIILSVWYIYTGTDTGTGKGQINLYDAYQNIPLFGHTDKLINPVSWTLYYEMFFYIIFSFVILNKLVGGVIMVFWLAGIAITSIFSIDIPIQPDHAFNQYNILFLIGLSSSYVYVWLKRINPELRNKFGVIANGLGILVFSVTSYYCVAEQITDGGKWVLLASIGLASGLFMLGALSDVVEGFLKKQKTLIELGNASYSIYLLHFFFLKEIITWIKTKFPSPDTLFITTSFIIVCASAILAGWLFYWKIERPLLKSMRGLIKLSPA